MRPTEVRKELQHKISGRHRRLLARSAPRTSASRTEIAVPYHQFLTSVPDKLFYDKIQENFASFYTLPILSQNVLQLFLRTNKF